MKSKSTAIVALAVTGMLAFSNNLTAQPHHPHHHHVSPAAMELNQDMRKLWEDHIVWTRNVICNVLDNLPGTNEAVTRLLQNQADIGNAFKPYFGNNAGNTLTNLLYGHINTAAALLTALANSDTAALTVANNAWYANADSIAHFLHSINPHQWSYQDLFDMMDEHLDLTTDEAVARKTQDYAADVAAYDSVHLEILDMADFFTQGIVKRFPHQFRTIQSVTLTDNDFILEQNAPNPFTSQTMIDYYIPENTSQAEIIFTDEAGKTIKKVVIAETGEGTLTVYADNLNEGYYSYSIIADGKVIDTKRMACQK